MMLTSIVILQILIKTKGELGEANRAASMFSPSNNKVKQMPTVSLSVKCRNSIDSFLFFNVTFFHIFNPNAVGKDS